MRAIVCFHRRLSFRGLAYWSGFLLALAGGAMVVDYLAVVGDTDYYQARQSVAFEAARRQALSTSPLPLLESPLSPAPAAAQGLAPGIVGRIEIPSIGLSAMVAEGVDSGTLRRAVGHLPGTALPGQPGNSVFAAHRDTFFRALRHIRRNDEVTLTTLRGRYRYRVQSIEVLGPGDVWVLKPGRQPTATLITCFPFDYVGAAPRRFVVRAVQLPARSHGLG